MNGRTWAGSFDEMGDDEQDWLSSLGYDDEGEWPPKRRGPTVAELKAVFDQHTRGGFDGEALDASELRMLWAVRILIF